MAGGFTTTKPVAPNHAVFIGIVTRSHENAGSIELRIANGFEVEELHDVSVTNKADGDLLAYEHYTGLWKNKSASALGLITSQSAASLFLKLDTGGTISNGVMSSYVSISPYTQVNDVHSGVLSARDMAGKITRVIGSGIKFPDGTTQTTAATVPSGLYTEAQAAIDLAAKADLVSPWFTGEPKAPTQPLNTNNDTLATTQFVQDAITDQIVDLTPVEDAPADNQTYNRRNNQWVPTSPGATAQWGSIQGDINEQQDVVQILRQANQRLYHIIPTSSTFSTTASGTGALASLFAQRVLVRAPDTAAGFASAHVNLDHIQRGMLTAANSMFDWSKKCTIKFNAQFQQANAPVDANSSVSITLGAVSSDYASIGHINIIRQSGGPIRLFALNQYGYGYPIDTPINPTPGISYDIKIVSHGTLSFPSPDPSNTGLVEIFIDDWLVAQSFTGPSTKIGGPWLALRAVNSAPITGFKSNVTVSNLSIEFAV